MSRTPRDEMEDLLDASVAFAEEMLTKRGEFYPFGAVVRDDGKVAMSAADPDLGDHPDSQSVIDMLTEALQMEARSGQIRASAICADVRVHDDGSGMSDAIRTTIEHRDADPIEVLLPYRLDSDSGLILGELEAGRAESAIFAA